MTAAPTLPQGIARVTERAVDGLYVHPGWAESMPWLVQGITGRTADMSLFGGSAAGAVIVRWHALRDALGASTIVHSRQVHAASVVLHGVLPPGLFVAADADGHATAHPGLLLAVSVADCVPIFLVDPERRVVALLHGGWRGVAADILEHGIDVLSRRCRVDPHTLHVHFGPAICGACFEVGPEVPAGLRLQAVRGGALEGGGRSRIDLRAVLAERALRSGVPAETISTSAFCTRCGASPFYSHRGGCGERQIAVLGMRT